MPQTCSVPNCKGNYKKGPKVNVFKFPKDELAKKWLAAIKREGFTPTKNSRVSKHWIIYGIIYTEDNMDEKTYRSVFTRRCKINPYNSSVLTKCLGIQIYH